MAFTISFNMLHNHGMIVIIFIGPTYTQGKNDGDLRVGITAGYPKILYVMRLN